VAPPKKFKSAEELDRAIQAYMASHDSKDNPPTWAGMLLDLNISDRTMLEYRKNPDKYPGYCDVIKKAEQAHCRFWQQLALAHPNLQSFCMFELKQPHNGGFLDRPQDTGQNGEVTIKVQIDGISKTANGT
jgi:hypothetical protein